MRPLRVCELSQMNANFHLNEIIDWFHSLVSLPEQVYQNKFTIVRQYFYLSSECTYCLLVVALSRKGKHHSVWLQEMCNSYTSVFPNTRAFGQQELYKTRQIKKNKKRSVSMKRSKQGTKEKSCLDSLAYSSGLPSPGIATPRIGGCII